MEKTLKLYSLVDGGNDVAFPKDEQIEIFDFSYDAKRMGGAPVITASIMHGTCLDDLWTDRVYTIFNGEKYFLKQTPTSSKSNTDERYKHEIELVSERIILDNVYFYDVVQEDLEIDKPVSNKSRFSFHGTIEEFVVRLNESLQKSGVDYSVVIDEGISSESKLLSFSDTFFSNALQEIYNTYNIPYYFKDKVIHLGYTDDFPEHTFEYGAKNSLLSITKTNRNLKLINRITGMGSTDNIPYYYPNKEEAGSAIFTIKNASESDVRKIDIATIKQYDQKWKYNEYTLCKVDGDYSFSANLFVEDGNTLIVATGEAIDEPYAPITNNWKGTSLTYKLNYNEDVPFGVVLVQAYEINLKAEVQYDFRLNDRLLTGTFGLPVWMTKVDDRLYIAKKDDAHRIENLKEATNLNLWFDREYYPEGYIACGAVAAGDGEKQLLEYPSLKGDYLVPRTLEGDYILLRVQRVGYSNETKVSQATTQVGYPLDTPLSTIEGYMAKGDKYIFRHFYGNVDYEDSGIFFNDVDNTPHATITYEHNALTGAITEVVENEDSAAKIRLLDAEYVTPSTNLMPSVYRETKGEERFYNALNDTYNRPNSDTKYVFANPYIEGRPKEHIIDFEDIKPTIKNVVNDISWSDNDDNGDAINVFQRIDMFSEFAFDENDNDDIDYEGNYVHPYFYAKLRKMPFNLFECAIDESEMSVSMTSGSCGGCEWVIGVNDSQKNTVQVDADGNLLRNSKGDVIYGKSPQKQQNDTMENEVWIALKKEESTFGVIMPNAANDYKPKSCTSETANDGDTFILLHIAMPLEYVIAAEKELDAKLIQYMFENNTEKFDFSIKFSRIFLAENPNILAQVNENSRLKINYNGKEHILYVSSFTYKKSASEALPEITVSLTDELTINENTLQSAVDGVKQELVYHIGNIDWLAVGEKYFLRKDARKDTSNTQTQFTKKVTFSENEEEDKNTITPQGDAILNSVTTTKDVKALGGMEVGDFQSGMFGSGANIDENGHAELQSMKLWSWLEVPELRYNRAVINVGVQMDSVGGGVIDKVMPEYNEDGTITGRGTCTLKLEEGEYGKVSSGDLCMGIWHDKTGNAAADADNRKGDFTFKGFKTVYFEIIQVSGTNNDTFTYKLRPSSDGGNDIHPFMGMHFGQRGNTQDSDRQGFRYATTEYTVLLKDVSTWNWNESNIVGVDGLLDGFTYGGKTLVGYGQLLGNAYMYGVIEELEKAGKRMEVTSTRNILSAGKEAMVTIKILDGYNADRTSEIDSITLTRNTGDSASDEEWNSTHTDLSTPFILSYDDISSATDSATFTIKVSMSDSTFVNGSLVLSKDTASESTVVYEIILSEGYYKKEAKGTVLGSIVGRVVKRVGTSFTPCSGATIEAGYNYHEGGTLKEYVDADTIAAEDGYFSFYQHFGGYWEEYNYSDSIWVRLVDEGRVLAQENIGLVSDGESATTYDIVLSNAHYTVDSNKSVNNISGIIEGYLYEIKGDERTPVVNATITFGYANTIDTTGATTTTGKNGFFSTGTGYDMWFTDTWDDANTDAIVLKSQNIIARYEKDDVIVAQVNVGMSKTGANGDKGKRGAPMRVSQWAEGWTYYSGENDGDLYSDVVLWNGEYRRCTTNHIASESNKPTNDDNQWWARTNQFEMVATKLFLAQKAYIDNLVATMIQTATVGQRLVAEGNNISFFGNGKYPVLKLGINSAGDGVLTYCDEDTGVPIYNLDKEGITKILVEAINEEVITVSRYRIVSSTDNTDTEDTDWATYMDEIFDTSQGTMIMYMYIAAQTIDGTFAAGELSIDAETAKASDKAFLAYYPTEDAKIGSSTEHDTFTGFVCYSSDNPQEHISPIGTITTIDGEDYSIPEDYNEDEYGGMEVDWRINYGTDGYGSGAYSSPILSMNVMKMEKGRVMWSKTIYKNKD